MKKKIKVSLSLLLIPMLTYSQESVDNKKENNFNKNIIGRSMGSYYYDKELDYFNRIYVDSKDYMRIIDDNKDIGINSNIIIDGMEEISNDDLDIFMENNRQKGFIYILN